MELNKIIAELDFVEATIHSIQMSNNTLNLSESSEKSFGLDIKHSQPVVKEDKKYGKLLLEINILIKPENPELKQDAIKLVMEGLFSTSNTMEDDRFLQLLNINGGAALYSIARAKIEAISGLVYNDGKILLPMINMLQYYQEKSNAESTEE